MADSVNVHNIQVLSDLRQALGRFAGRAEEALLTTEAEIRRILDWLQMEVSERRRTVAHRRQEVEQALDDLKDCQRSADDNYEPDCSHEERELDRAERRLEEANDELQLAQRWQREVETEVEHFRVYIARLRELATVHALKGQALLEKKLAELEHYQSVATQSGPLLNTLPGSASVAFTNAKPASVSNVASTAVSSDGGGLWVERGIQDVELSSLPDISEINGPDEFHKVKMHEMEAGLNRLLEMKPIIDSGRGADKEYWREIDQQRGLDYENGYQRVYEAFYGHDAIRLEKVGNNYNVVNGRHRIWLAKTMGIKSLPAKVVERT